MANQSFGERLGELSWNQKLVLVGCLGIIAIGLFYYGAIYYATRVAPARSAAALVVLNQFYAHSQKRQYGAARTLMTRHLAESISEKDLAARWAKFEKENGPISRWIGAGGGIFGGGVNIWPPEVAFDTFVLGQKQDRGRVLTRLVPEDGTWRIQSLEIYP